MSVEFSLKPVPVVKFQDIKSLLPFLDKYNAVKLLKINLNFNTQTLIL